MSLKSYSFRKRCGLILVPCVILLVMVNAEEKSTESEIRNPARLEDMDGESDQSPEQTANILYKNPFESQKQLSDNRGTNPDYENEEDTTETKDDHDQEVPNTFGHRKILSGYVVRGGHPPIDDRQGQPTDDGQSLPIDECQIPPIQTIPQKDALDYPQINSDEDEEDQPAYHRQIHSELAKKVRVLCLVLTKPDKHETHAIHVKNTWGKKCNRLIFMSTEEDASLGAIDLQVMEGKDYLWNKTKAAFQYVHKHYRNQADWFLKADDDTYVILENLRNLLSNYSTSEAIYLGRIFKHTEAKDKYSPRPPEKWGYMTGGAGYVLSRASLDLLVENIVSSPQYCLDIDSGAEDIYMGLCLERIGVRAVETRDSLGRETFFQTMPFDYKDSIYNCRNGNCPYYPFVEGIEGCSKQAISFHGILPAFMYSLDYLIYHLGPNKQHSVSNRGVKTIVSDE